MNSPAVQERLTLNDRNVIRLGALGISDKEIAARLGVSTSNVVMQFVRLRKRIGNFDRAYLPGLALLLGIVSIADITRDALLFLQGPDAPEKPRGEHEGAD